MDRKSMKCWSFVHNIAALRINAPFPSFRMPSSNLMGFGTWRLQGTILMRVIYLLLNSYWKYSDKKERQEIHWSTLNTYWARQKAFSVFMEFIRRIRGCAGLSNNSGVLGNGCPKPCINTFPYYHSMFKGRALLS